MCDNFVFLIDFRERKVQEMKEGMPARDVGHLLGMIHNGAQRCWENDPLVRELDGITGKNVWIIGYLNRHQDQPVYQKDLEKAFNVTRSTASKVLTLMEKKGFVERRMVAEDARLRQIVLTEPARGIADRMEQKRQHMEQLLIRGFDEEEKAQLNEYLNRILDNLYNESEVNED